MTEEKYYKLTFHTKHSVGSFYLKSNGVIQMTNLSDTIKNSKLEEISKKKYAKDINDSQSVNFFYFK